MTIVHVTIPKSSNSSCNIIASHTRQAAPISQDLMDLLRMVGVAKKLMDKAGKEGKPWISGLFDYRVTPQSGSIASPLQLMTQCTPREKSLPQLPSALGAPELHQTCQELIKRQGNSKPERITPRYTSLGATQAECYMGTSNSCEPMCTRLLWDSARKWCRTT